MLHALSIFHDSRAKPNMILQVSQFDSRKKRLVT
jgi:hypothetical protein